VSVVIDVAPLTFTLPDPLPVSAAGAGMGNMNMGAMLGMVNNPMLGMGMAGVRPGVNGFGMCMLPLCCCSAAAAADDRNRFTHHVLMSLLALLYQVVWVWA